MKKTLLGLVTGTAFVLALGFIPAAVLAEDRGSSEEEFTTISTTEDTSRGAALKQRLLELKAQRLENRQQRLEDNKLRVCENRKTKVASIMNRGIIRAERQLALFDTIAERVKAFYAEKGYSLENYDELVADADAAKADVQATLELLKGLEPFDCASEDPKGNVEAFKLAMQSMRQDLKDYRTSVKDLIVGVKSAQSTAAAGEEGGDE